MEFLGCVEGASSFMCAKIHNSWTSFFRGRPDKAGYIRIFSHTLIHFIYRFPTSILFHSRLQWEPSKAFACQNSFFSLAVVLAWINWKINFSLYRTFFANIPPLSPSFTNDVLFLFWCWSFGKSLCRLHSRRGNLEASPFISETNRYH